MIRQHRLITLTGPGGTGKTRLSIQLAREVAYLYPDGVFWIPLAAVHDSEIVAFAIANELGLKEDSLLSIEEVLIQYFQDKRILLVLDNFEQILDAAGLIEELLLSCENLKVLVSSRIILQIAGEEEYQVSPLPLPELNSFNVLEGLQEVPSVALFAERARSSRRNFKLTKDNVEAIAHICQRLDGLPLAIELAAARTKLFSPAKLLSRLTNSLDVLKGGRQYAERHQTLRQTIAWSYDLLETEEQELFRRSSVFVGGSTIEAVEEVCGQNGLSDWNIEDGVMALVDKSLIKTEETEDELRFYMLETIREYAVEALHHSNKAELFKKTHIQYYLNLAEEGVSSISGPDGAYWTMVLFDEQANFRAAIDYAIELGEMSFAYRLGMALRPFWGTKGMTMEGIQQLEKITAGEVLESLREERLTVLQMLGMLYMYIPLPNKAILIFEECLLYWRRQKKKHEIGLALNDLGWASMASGKCKMGVAYSFEAKAIFEKLSIPGRLAASCTNLGFLFLNRYRVKEAIPYFEKSFELTRQIEDKRRNAYAISNLGLVHYYHGVYPKAESQLKQSLIIHRNNGDKLLEAYATVILGRLYYSAGDFNACQQFCGKALELARVTGANFIITEAILNQGMAAFGKGKLEEAMEKVDLTISIHQKFGKSNSFFFDHILIYTSRAQVCFALGEIGMAKESGELLLENQLEEECFSGLIPSLEIASRIALIEEKPEDAARLFFHAQTLRKEMGTPIFPSESHIYTQLEVDLKSRISKKNLKLLQNQTFSLPDLVELAHNIFTT